MIPRTRKHGSTSDTLGAVAVPGSCAVSSAAAAGARQMTPAPAVATATVNFV
jgi:hypothetical protein